MEETFTLLPLHLDPASKALSAPTISTPSLTSELTAINTLHRSLLQLDSASVPPPPLPLNPKRSAQIQKMREQGNALYKKGSTTSLSEAIRIYTFGLEMALGRPAWEPNGIVKDEVSLILCNRAQAHIALGNWPEGAVDAGTSVEMKRIGNGKAWWRKGRCLVEMSRWDEAQEWVSKGLEVEGGDVELKTLMADIEQHMKKRESAGGR